MESDSTGRYAPRGKQADAAAAPGDPYTLERVHDDDYHGVSPARLRDERVTTHELIRTIEVLIARGRELEHERSALQHALRDSEVACYDLGKAMEALKVRHGMTTELLRRSRHLNWTRTLPQILGAVLLGLTPWLHSLLPENSRLVIAVLLVLAGLGLILTPYTQHPYRDLDLPELDANR